MNIKINNPEKDYMAKITQDKTKSSIKKNKKNNDHFPFKFDSNWNFFHLSISFFKLYPSISSDLSSFFFEGIKI